MRSKRFSLFILASTLGLGLDAYATEQMQSVAKEDTGTRTYQLKSTDQSGSVAFTAMGNPAFISIEGKGKGTSGELSVKNNIAKGVFKFKLTTLDTGIDTRNEHMKNKYLKTDEYPEATLEISNLELPKNYTPAAGLGGGKFVGKLTLKGVTRDITGTFESKGKNQGKEAIVAKFDIKLSDFGVEIPSFAGITVANNVDIAVDTTLEDVSAEAR